VIAVRTVVSHLSRSPGITKVIFVCHSDRAFRMCTDAIQERARQPRGVQGREVHARQGGHPEQGASPADIRDQLTGQLQMIELVHGIRFVNSEALIAAIEKGAADPGRVSLATAALNSWVAVQHLHGEVEVPEEVLDSILKKIREQ
jgi:hypothetical protein